MFKWLLRALFGSRADADLDDEVRAHLEIERQQRIDAGAQPAEAEAAARKDFGNILLVKEETRAVWGWRWLEHLGQDLRYAVRTVTKNPGFAVTAILSISLGIGATTAVFAIYDAVVLRPMSVPKPERLVLLVPNLKGQRWILVNPVFEAIRERQQSMTGIFAANEASFFKTRFEGEGAPNYLRASLVTGAYFQVLGLSPAAGRFLAESDDQIPGATGDAGCAVVISYRLWEQRFHLSPQAIGQGLEARNVDCTIVGVTPAGFRSHQPGFESDLWLPMRQFVSSRDLQNYFGAFFSGVAGRLKDGVSAAQAQAELTTLFQQIQDAAPRPPANIPDKPVPGRDVSISVVPGGHGFNAIQREFERSLGLILMLAASVLLIAAANVSGLILSRGAARGAELATRAAIGASAGRLIRQLLAEGLVLAALGGFVGAAIAYVAVPGVASFIRVPWMPITLEIPIDHRILLAAFGFSVASALLASIVPAIRLSHSDPHVLITGAGRVTRSAAGGRLGRAFVVAQLALSFGLTVSAGLLLTTMARLLAVDPGFRAEHVLTFSIQQEGSANASSSKERRMAFYEKLEAELAQIPGVQNVSLSWLGLFGGSDLSDQTFDPALPDRKELARIDYVSAKYFETAGIPILRGRPFARTDRAGAPNAAIVNEAFVAAKYGKQDAVGRQIAVSNGGENPVFTIVGVAGNSKYNGLREAVVKPMIWLPASQLPQFLRSVMVRVQPGMESAVAQEVPIVLRSVDRDWLVRRSTTLAAVVRETTLRERLTLGLAAGFAGVALLLAAVGVYGSVSFAVASRAREIGLRIALGADASSVMRVIVGSALRLALWGLILGVPLAFAAGGALRSVLFGVEAHDYRVIGAAGFVLGMAALVAAWIPARRAARIDPLAALRSD